MTNVTDMNEEQLARYVAEILSSSLIKQYTFETFKTEDKSITKFSMKSRQGWTIDNRDEWED